jgi:hypothetical protein
MEFEDELESGAAGAVLEESEGALGAADCCFEQATIASALKHNKRRLRFIRSSLCSCISGGQAIPGHSRRRWDSTLGRKPRSIAAFPSR